MTTSSFPLTFKQETSATLRLATPLAAAAVAQMGMGLTDTILLGSLGRDALAAGGLGAGLFFTTTAIMQAAMTGVGVLVAHARGAGAHEQVSPIFRSGTLLALFASIPASSASPGNWPTTSDNMSESCCWRRRRAYCWARNAHI